MIQKNMTGEPAESHKGDVFTIGELVFTRDFRSNHYWTAGTVVKRRGKGNFETQVNELLGAGIGTN